jgi:hypothetical protein
MDHLLFITDISQLKYLQINTPELLENMLPVTNDMVVAFEFERLGIKFIDEWDFLSENQMEENRKNAHFLAKNWWDEQVASTEYNGLFLSDLVEQDLVYPLEASLNARTVYAGLLDTYLVKKISGFFLPAVPVVRTGPVPTAKAVHSVSQAILFYMAERRGIEVNHLQLPKCD